MDFGNLSLLRLAQDRMQWVSNRQDVVAQNIANANTPGYEARDIADFDSYLDRSASATRHQPVATRAGHFTEGAAGSDTIRSDALRDPATLKPTGNEVSLETELMKVAENHTNHDLALNIYRKNSDMIRAAVGTGGM